MNLRNFLEERERELVKEISQLRDALIPMESELAEIRRAKAAIGVGVSPSSLRTDEAVKAIERSFDKARAAKIGAFATDSMTMKQLVVKVLTNHFPAGATAKQMVDFFNDVWGRAIERTNLSPQISRLHQEGIIGRLDGTKAWYLLSDDRRGKRPYRETMRQMSCGQLTEVGEKVVWLTPEEVTQRHSPIWPMTIDADTDED